MFDFGKRIQQLRLSHKMSQEMLGKKLNRSKSVICGYENNLRIPPLDILVSISRIFNVSLDYLVGIDKNEMITIGDLSEGQKKIIYSIVNEFKKEETSCPGLTEKQQEILNKVIVEFNKKHK